MWNVYGILSPLSKIHSFVCCFCYSLPDWQIDWDHRLGRKGGDDEEQQDDSSEPQQPHRGLFGGDLKTSSLSSSSDFHLFQELWSSRLSLLPNCFDLIEPVMALRTVLLQLAGQWDLLANHLRSLASFARESNR
jgi:hypothetical protein